MKKARKITAYCGLCCADCIPGNKELFKATRRLQEIIEETGLAKYASFKAAKSGVFNNFDIFLQVLHEINRLECSGSCFEGPISDLGCKSDCEIRSCVLEHKLNGCWECKSSKNCGKLTELKAFHPGLENNLEAIKQHGLDNWLKYRGKHYKWSKK
jgi:hypothetical protein